MSTTIVYSDETLKKMKIKSDRYEKTKSIAKLIAKQLKTEYPDCKFSVRTKDYSTESNIRIYLMAAPFEALSRPDPYDIYKTGCLYVKRECFVNDYKTDDYKCGDIYLTPEAWDVFKRATEIVLNQELDKNVKFHLMIGDFGQPFVKLE